MLTCKKKGHNRKKFYCLEKTKHNCFAICLQADPHRGILFHYLHEVNCSYNIEFSLFFVPEFPKDV